MFNKNSLFDSTKLILIFDLNFKILLFKNDILSYSVEYLLDNNDIIDGIIFNFTKIERLISNFIAKYNLKNLSTIILLKDDFVFQALNQNLELDPKVYYIKSYELQFYPQTVSYTLGIKHYQLFQYSLLCSKLSIKLTSITTAILDLHKLFKAHSHKKIDSNIGKIETLTKFFKASINESKSENRICNSKKDFDRILMMY